MSATMSDFSANATAARSSRATGDTGDEREFRVGVRSLPYLADHAVRDMIVLPGSFYLTVARELDRERGAGTGRAMRNVEFQNPIVLGDDDLVVRVYAGSGAGDGVEHTFVEGGPARQTEGRIAPRAAARLVVGDQRSPRDAANSAAFSVDAFRERATEVIEADRFYAALRANGNQYGPNFRRVLSVWRSGREVLGRLSGAPLDLAGGARGVRTCVLDAATQLLSTFAVDQGRTFILRSVDTAVLSDAETPATLWAHVALDRDGDAGQYAGSVRVFDESGATYAELTGVNFAFLDRPAARADESTTTVAVASNITAEPLEDSLRFWGDHFGAPVRTEFAPYNQVFQQLLDPSSAFRANRSGVNVVLLSLEEWAAPGGAWSMPVDAARVAQSLGNRARYTLPNGLEIAQLNDYETSYVYKEVFEDQAYLRHGIQLHDGDTVIDIGANIGLFSLFVMSRCKDPRIIAFEPAPAVYELLKANCEAYGANVHVANAGVSGAPGTATFTFYEKSSVFSGFHADAGEDRAAIEAVVRNTLSSATTADGEAVEAFVAELTAERLGRTTHECRLTTVSEIIRERGLERIDLLKIDAERSELEILRGIEEADWPRISQIVMEVHDRTRETITRIEALLSEKGFRCAVELERLLEDSGLYNLYATRSETNGVTNSAPAPARALDRTVREFGDALAGFMRQTTTPLVLCVGPRTPPANADAALRSALVEAEAALLSGSSAIPNVHVIGSELSLQRYAVGDYYDAHSHQLGHIPYTPACFAAIGTSVFRTMSGLTRKPYKVIVLDCDNTLWKGVCGEDGASGVELTPAHLALQRFVVNQANAGMLVCLCSKNAEQDVFDVFDQRPEMVLKREHLVSWRIDWRAKGENVRSLARELELGLDSFIFVDDNPVECADVAGSCPGVLTLQLPTEPERIGSFLDHVWAFDRAQVTDEDRRRTAMYRQNAERERFRDDAMSLADFVKGLDVRVEISDATDDDLARVAQLTQRTNQFNLTTVRRTRDEVREFIDRPGSACLVVRVADRFGDYGLVGAVLYESDAECVRVDSFMLSCRVLGRGVEHAVVAYIGERAAKTQQRSVEFVYRPTPRNAPARAFLDAISPHAARASETVSVFAADVLARIEYRPADLTTDHRDDAAALPLDARESSASPVFGAGARPEPLRDIAERFADVDRLINAIDAHRVEREAAVAPAATPAADAPVGTLEASLLRIWRHVLGRPRIGPHDNFFDAGGTSLKAVQVLAAIKQELGLTLSIVSLFDSPTVARLAARFDGGSNASDGAAADAISRGQKRRRVVHRRAP